MKAMTTSGLEYGLDNSTIYTSCTILVDLIAKNVLAGRVCLFEFDNNFKFEYGQGEGGIYSNITSMESELPISINVTNTSISTSDQFNWIEVKEFNAQQDYSYNYKYNLKAHSYEPGVSYNSVELKPYDEDGYATGDIFTLQQIDKETNRIFKTYEFSAKSNVAYNISLSNDSTLLNSDNNTFSILQNCVLKITKQENYKATSSGTQNLDYVLKGNEVVQIIHPNYYSTKTYGTYVSYNYTGPDILADVETKLTSPIKFSYTKDGVTQSDTWPNNTVIRSNFNIYNTDTISDKVSKDGDWYGVLSSNQTISKRERMLTILDNTNLMCYWIINSSSTGENRLFDPGETDKILGDDDYFIYADEGLNDIIIVGSGTKLTRDQYDDRDWLIATNNYDIEAVTEAGTGANIPWRRLDFNKYNLGITEMSIYTLGEGDRIVIYDWEFADDGITDHDFHINNNWVSCSANIKLIVDGEEKILPKAPRYYFIRSRLDINMSVNQPQTLYHSEQATQIIRAASSTGVYEISSSPDHKVQIQSSEPLSLLGGKNIDLSIYKLNNIDLKLYSYYADYIKPYVVENGSIREFKGRVISIPNDKALPTHVFPFWFYNSNNMTYPETNEVFILPVYVENPELEVATGVVYLDQNQNTVYMTINDFNSDNLPTVRERWGGTDPKDLKRMVLKGGKKYYLYIKSGTTATDPVRTQELRLLFWTSEGLVSESPACVVVDDPIVVNGINNKLSTTLNPKFSNNPVLRRMKELVLGSDNPDLKPDYLYNPDSSMVIDLDKYMYVNAITGEYDMLAFDNPLILFDSNNVAHDMSIAEVDIANSSIDIARDMRSYN